VLALGAQLIGDAVRRRIAGIEKDGRFVRDGLAREKSVEKRRSSLKFVRFSTVLS
jgi:hypothetical protein